MKNSVTAAVMLFLLFVAACATPVPVRVEWRQPDRKPKARIVEFEEYQYFEEGDSVQVYMKHEESFMPWEFNRHYLGETLLFAFDQPGPDGEPIVIKEASYQLKAYSFYDTRLIEGTVTPVAEDPDSPGDFRLVFDTSNFGEHISTITFTGRLRR